MPPSPHGELTKESREKLAQLRSRAQVDATFAALVDMYRNVHWEPETAAYWMAEYDLAAYAHEDGSFTPLTAGYGDEELKFLSKRGVSML